jgi:hypothetical protein
MLCLVHDQSGPALFLVPLEASEVGVVEFVVRLAVSRQSSNSFVFELELETTDLFLKLLVDGV